ncbi:MinD/ParA family protein [Rhodococcus sp. NPDC003318]|uniref:MinD/ParA family ATP-binding protein n=1 Tax=Rhodococcus sp. NPDC003318 TaxID=3364503 RepID=UPI0036924471
MDDNSTNIANYHSEAPVNLRAQRLRRREPEPATEPEIAEIAAPEPETVPDPYHVGQAALVTTQDAPTRQQPGPGRLFDSETRAADDAPAKWGLRGRMNAALGLKMKPKEGSAEVRFRASVDTIQRTLPGTAMVTVANTKGDAGKTSTLLTLSAIFGQHRGAGVVAWDASESGGTLGARAARTVEVERTVWDLLDNAARLVGPDAAAGDLAAFLRRQPTRDEVLAGDTDTSHDYTLGWDECAAIAAVLRRHRDLMFVDTANNPQSPSWQWAVQNCDLLVVPLPMRSDMAGKAYDMLEGLLKRGFEDVVRGAVVLLCATPGSSAALEDRIVTGFEELGVETFVRIPYEPTFSTGERIDLDRLTQESVEAWTNVAAIVADRLGDALTARLRPVGGSGGRPVASRPAPEPEPEREPDLSWMDEPTSELADQGIQFTAPEPTPPPAVAPAPAKKKAPPPPAPFNPYNAKRS